MLVVATLNSNIKTKTKPSQTAKAEPGVYSIKGCNGEEGVLITCPPPPRPVVTEMTQME